jgi:hypothetical protein
MHMIVTLLTPFSIAQTINSLIDGVNYCIPYVTTRGLLCPVLQSAFLLFISVVGGSHAVGTSPWLREGVTAGSIGQSTSWSGVEELVSMAIATTPTQRGRLGEMIVDGNIVIAWSLGIILFKVLVPTTRNRLAIARVYPTHTTTVVIIIKLSRRALSPLIRMIVLGCRMVAVVIVSIATAIVRIVPAPSSWRILPSLLLHSVRM